LSAVTQYARLIRLPNVFTACADVSIGLLAAGGSPGHAALVIAGSACLYASGMAWNDYFDRAVDATERPSRPIPSGAITSRNAAASAGILMALGVTLGSAAGLSPGIHAVMLAGLILAYDGFAKATPAGPYFMGSCRFANVLLGFAGSTISWPLRAAVAGIVGIYVVGVTVFARDEAERSQTARLTAGAGLCLAALAAAAAIPSGPTWRLALLAVLAAVLATRLRSALAEPMPRAVQRFVKAAILGLVALDASLAVALAGPAGLAILLWWIPAVVLGRQLYST
jgi:4-hydroxybenzoate polyprenyltransferase